MSQRQQSSRRTVLQTLASLGAVTLTGSAAAGARTDRDTARAESIHSQSNTAVASDDSDGVDRYVGVVDRIVDGEHVVILLEDDGELVDQHVAPRSELEDVEERDVLLVVLRDDELLVAQQLPKRPGRSASGHDDSSPSVDDLAEEL